MRMTETELQERLVEYLEQQADWRERKAEEYPEDARNASAAHGLHELAEYVAALPATDARLARLFAEYDGYDVAGDPLDEFAVGAEAAALVSRFRFDDPPTESCAAFLDRLAGTMAEDREIATDEEVAR